MFWIPAKDASVPNMLRKDQLEPANQLSLVTTYGFTPVLAAVVFALLAVIGAPLSEVVPVSGGRSRRRSDTSPTSWASSCRTSWAPSSPASPARRRSR